MEENKNIEDPKYVKNVYNALKSKVDGFNKTEQEFNESLKDEAYVMNVHNALSKKINGFNKTSDEFKTLMMPLKKKDGTKTPSTSTTKTPNTGSVPTNGSLDSKQQNKQSAFSTKKVGLPDASGKLVNPISVNEKTPYENENLRIANKAYDYALSKLDKKTSEDRLSSELNQYEFSDGLKEGAKSLFNSIIGDPLTKINEKLGGNKDFKIGEYKPLQKELILAEKEIRKEKPGVKNISSVEIKDRAEKIFIENDLQTQMNQLIDESLPYGYDREGVFKELKLKEINSNDFLRQKIIGAEVHKKQIEQFTDFEKTINKENPTEQDVLQYNSLFEKASIAVKSLKHLEENFDNILKEAKTDGEKLELFKYNYNDFEKFSSNLYTTSLGIIGGASKLAGDTIKYVSPEANKNTPTKVIGNALSGLGDEMMKDANALSNQFYNYKASSLNSFSDLGSFAGQLISQQLPILGTIYLGGNFGVGAVSMSSGGQKIQGLEEQEKSSFGAINYSDGKKLAAGWLYAGAEFFPEKIGTTRIFKDLERTVASASSASRKLFNQGLIKSTPKAIRKTAFNIGLEGGTEYITTEGQITIDQELLGIIKTDYEKKELRKESTIAGGFMGGAMSIGGGAMALIVSQSKLYSDNNDIREVQSLLKNIDKIQQEIENNSLLTDEEKTSLYKEMNEINNKAFDIVAKNANKGVDLSFQDKSLLVDFNSKQIDLKEKYKEIVNSNFSKEIKDSKIKEIESEFNTLEKNRVKVLNGEYTVLDSMSDSESLKYKYKAAKELLADAKSKGLTDTKIKFTEEQINKKAIEIYNNSKINLNAKKGDELYTNEIKTKVDDVQENAVTKEEQSPQSQTEIKETEQEVLDVDEETETTTTISEALNDNKDIYVYNGEKGQVNLSGEIVVFETNDKIIDLGNINDLSEATLEEFGITKEQELDIVLNEDNSIEFNGKKYVNNYSNPESAFSKDKDGNYTVSLETENGQKRTFRGQQADQIVYQTKLKNFEQNATEQQIEEASRLADEIIESEKEIRESSPKRKGKSVRKGKRTTLKKTSSNNGKITDVEYSDFIDKGIVSEERLSSIANKVKNQEKLSEKETAIFNDKTSEINEILKNEATPAENNVPDGNSGIGVKPLGEMGEAAKQEGAVDNQEGIQPTVESKPTEGKVQAVKISVGKYDYTFENGTWTAKDKDGNIKEKNKSTYINKKGKKVKRKEKYIPNKVYEEFAKTINFTEGEKVIDDPYVNGEEYVYEVAKRSKNPAEIAGEIAYAETQDFNEKKHPLLLAIAKVIGTKSVNRQSFIDASDISNINQSIGLQYFTPKEKGKGKGIDQIAQYVEIEFYGDYNANEPRVTEEDIVKFILDNPGGTEKFLNENKNEILDSLKTAFTDVTGLPANQKFLEQAIDQQIEKQERIAGQDILFAYNQEQLIELSKELDEFKKQENGTETTTNKSDEKISNPKNIAESQPKSESEEVSGKQVEGNKRRTDQINDILNDLDKRLEDFGRNNLGINIAGVVARGAIKAMKLANNGVATLEDVVKAGIDYIKSTDWYQNLDESKQDMINENTLLDILDNTIKENEKSKKVIADLRQKIKDNKSNAKQIVEDIKNFLANNSIDGVLTPAQADALIRKSNDILVATDTLKAFDKFIEYYEKVKTKAENKLNDKAKIKAKYEQQKKQVLDLKAQGKSLADIISILNQSRVKELSEKETQIVEMIFKTADVAKMTNAEIKTYVDEMFAESRKIVSDSNKPWKRVKESFKGLRVKFLDSQATAKKILNKSNLSLVTDRMIALKGASAKAEIVFEQAKTKIYSKLNTEQRQKLDEIISLRRIIAIDKNRAERGLTPLLHSKYVNGEMSQRKLETMEQDMGKEEFDNLNERADFYFDEFRNILNEMEENGLISKQTRDQLFEVDYQPRKFLHHLMNGSEEISENAKAWQKSTYGLSGDQVLKLDQGSVEAMVLNSEWLLATAVSMRQKSMFMNKLNTKLATEFNKKSTEIEALRQKPNKTKAEIKQIKEFKNLSETFIPNPIIGVTKSGNPKYKYNTVKPGYRNAYYYVNGVQQKIMMKEEIYEQWFGEKKFINNPKAIEKLAKWSGSRLLKTMATGRNPLFFITNTPRDFVNTLIVSPEYSKFKLLAAGQLIKDLLKSFVAIKNKNDSFEKYFEYGGGMSFLSSEGMLTGKSLTREILENSKNKTVKTILDANIKDKAGKVLDWLTLHELNQYSELIFRIAIFDRTVKNELGKINETDINSLSKEQQEDIYFRAVASARSVMDFNQGGYITKDMESVMPYLNAATQGSRVLMDAFVERPIETTSNILQLTAMGVTGAMGMSIALSGLGKDDDDERTSTQIYLENLEMVSPYDRRNFFIIFTGRKDEDGNPEYLKFAKAQQITPFTQIAEHHTENYFRKQYGLKEKDNLLEKSLSAVNDNISPIQFMSFKDDPSLVGISLMARNPFGRAAMTYATGYDFYRQEKLSWDIDNKDVPKYMEGYTSDRVDDFYKELGQDLKISPIRTKAFVESIVTSPGTNPYLGVIYAGLDATMSEDQTKNRLEILKENTLKNIGKRAIGFGKPYNVTLEEKEKLKEQIEEIQAENIIFNKKVDDIAKGFINKTESRKVLVDRLKKELKLEPFKAERAVKRLEDKIKFSDVDQFYLDLKYENNNEVKALMIFNKFGDISKLSPEKRKEAGKQLEDISFTFNDETANKYRELLIEFEER